MGLNVRQKQADSLIRMLHFNNTPVISGRPEEESYKVLILDSATKDILAPLLHVNELRKHGVTLHMLLDSERQPIPDVPAVYFISPSERAIQLIAADARRGLYDSLYINFSTHVPRPLLEKLASDVAPSGTAAARIARVYDQHAQFISLESGLFTLGLKSTYLDLNDPRAQDTAIESAVHDVVEGLFCAIATLGTVPILRCPPGGAAEHVASKLDAKLRDALRSRTNIFTESATGSGLSASLQQRPLLCLFDRNFELSITLQHSWTYKPLVHDVLGMNLNRIALSASNTAVAARRGAAVPGGKSYEVDDADFFWNEHGREQFPKIAEQVEVELSKYKSSIEELNRTTGANVDPTADPSEIMSASTRGLMSAISSLPELTERKRAIDKHTNLATALLQSIKQRGLDQFYHLEEELVAGTADASAVVAAMRGAAFIGTAMDKLRLALVWLLTTSSSSLESECQSIEAVLTENGADMSAWMYVKRMRRLNLTGTSGPSGSGAAGGTGGGGVGGSSGGAQSQLTSLLGSTFGQGLTSLTKGVKNLLAGEQQAAVTVAVESLMENKPNSSDTDSYLIFDPKAPAGRSQRPTTPFKEAIVFMIGGGNYLEFESLSCWAARAHPTAKSVIYGATDLLNGEEMIEQLAELGRRSGGGGGIISS